MKTIRLEKDGVTISIKAFSDNVDFIEGGEMHIDGIIIMPIECSISIEEHKKSKYEEEIFNYDWLDIE